MAKWCRSVLMELLEQEEWRKHEDVMNAFFLRQMFWALNFIFLIASLRADTPS